MLAVVAACSQPAPVAHTTPQSYTTAAPSTTAQAQTQPPVVQTTPQSIAGSVGLVPYEIDVPASWNGTLLLFSHGYVPPGGTNVPQDAPHAMRTWLLQNHFALAGSAYRSSGWALEDAFKDQIALLDYFTTHVGKPTRVIAWGESMGGAITAGLIQMFPDRFAGALPMCGVVAGSIATWNSALDSAYAFKTLLAPNSALQLVHIAGGSNNLQLAEQILTNANATPRGRARLALVAAVVDLPGWYDALQPEPASTDYVARAAAQVLWESRIDFPFAFNFRAEVESRAGGNPSWNVGVDYSQLLAASPDRDEVLALYTQSGLDIQADLRTLNSGPRIKADPAAAAYLVRNIAFDGQISMPVLSLHTTGDGLVIPENESAYAQVVNAAGREGMLRQLFVHRAGHCTFSIQERIVALQRLVKRLDTGRWDDASLEPGALNMSARAEGADPSSTTFVLFSPGAFPRPFSKGSAIPA
jgi:pimeloyl-ACP methyl ester carboxylesterase